MVIELTPEQEASLEEIARHEGRSVQALMEDLASGFVEDNLRLREGVRRGLAQARAGQFVDEAEMQERWKRLLGQP